MALVFFDAISAALAAVVAVFCLIGFAVSHDTIYLYVALVQVALAAVLAKLARTALRNHDQDLAGVAR